MKKIFESRIFMFALGAILFSSITGAAAYALHANSVSYKPTASGWNVDNVSAALDSLYITKAEKTYSYDERVVGKWVDGKDIYQKSFLVTDDATINGSNSGANSTKVPGFSDEFVAQVLPTLDTLVNVENMACETDSYYCFQGTLRIIKSNGYIIAYDNPNVSYVGYRIYKGTVITIQYTKK